MRVHRCSGWQEAGGGPQSLRNKELTLMSERKEDGYGGSKGFQREINMTLIHAL